MARCTFPLQHSIVPWRKLLGHPNRVWVEGNSRGCSPPSQQGNSNSSGKDIRPKWAVGNKLCKLLDRKEMKRQATPQASSSVYSRWDIKLFPYKFLKSPLILSLQSISPKSRRHKMSVSLGRRKLNNCYCSENSLFFLDLLTIFKLQVSNIWLKVVTPLQQEVADI